MHSLETLFLCQQNSLACNRKKIRIRTYLRGLVMMSLLVSLSGSLFAAAKTRSKSSRSVKTRDIPSQAELGSLVFPTQPVNTSSAPLMYLATNYFSLTPMPIVSVDITGDFSATNNCNGAIAVGENCSFFVTFTPTAPGTRTGTLTINGGSSSPIVVALSGVVGPLTGGTTSTTVSSTGTAGGYALTGSVTGLRSTGSPTGSVSFIDASNNNLSLGTATLGAAKSQLSFANGFSVMTGTYPTNIAVADFNGDGKLDVVVTNSNYASADTTNPLTILLGNGDNDATFTTEASPVTPSNPSIVIAGDFNGDGKQDLILDGGTVITASYGSGDNSYSTSYSSLILLNGNGDGTFTVTSTSIGAALGVVEGLVTGDFNNDGKLDFLLSFYDGDSQTSKTVVQLNNGDGTFTAASNNLPFGGYAVSVVGDFNKDGKLDLAIENTPSDPSTPSTIEIEIGNGDGTFTTGVSQTLPSDIPYYQSTLLAGDFNGDGKLDLVAEGSGGVDGNLALTVLLGAGDGTFTAVSSVSPDLPFSTDAAGGVATGDFNGDGKTDLAVVDFNKESLLLSNGDGTFTTSASTIGATTGPSNLWLSTGDFNGDGIPDLITTNSDLNTAAVLIPQRSVTATATTGNISIPGSGSHNVQAVYAGDGTFIASTSDELSLLASPITTTLNINLSAESSTFGTQIVLTATLDPYASGSQTTNGEIVTFLNNGQPIGTASLSSGSAILNTTTLPVGSNLISASYAGDGNFTRSSSSPRVVLVNAASETAPAVTLSPTSLTFSSQTVGSTSPAQSVTLKNVGTAVLSMTVASSGDFAQTNNCGATLNAGASCTIAVTFTPTATGSRSGAITLTDNASNSPQTVALSGTGATASVASSSPTLTIASPGGSATTTIQVAGFTGAVNLTCAVSYQGQGTPSNVPTCSLNPAQVQATSNSPATSTLTINTTAAVSSLGNSLFKRTGASLAVFFLLVTFRRRRWHGELLFLILGLVTMGGFLGCGNSKPANGGSTTTSGTTVGSYQISVTATSGSVKASTTIPLSLQ